MDTSEMLYEQLTPLPKLHFVIFVFLPQIKTSDTLVKSIQHQGSYSLNPLIQCCINLSRWQITVTIKILRVQIHTHWNE